MKVIRPDHLYCALSAFLVFVLAFSLAQTMLCPRVTQAVDMRNLITT